MLLRTGHDNIMIVKKNIFIEDGLVIGRFVWAEDFLTYSLWQRGFEQDNDDAVSVNAWNALWGLQVWEHNASFPSPAGREESICVSTVCRECKGVGVAGDTTLKFKHPSSWVTSTFNLLSHVYMRVAAHFLPGSLVAASTSWTLFCFFKIIQHITPLYQATLPTVSAWAVTSVHTLFAVVWITWSVRWKTVGQQPKPRG